MPEAEDIASMSSTRTMRLIVIDKPAGLVVHPAAGHRTGTLVNALIAHCGASLSGIGGVKRPGIVHRLDKDTSGLLVVAKTDRRIRGCRSSSPPTAATAAWSGPIWRSSGACRRERKGRIEAALARHPADRTRMAVVAKRGRAAVTHYEVLETFPGSDGKPVASLVRCLLETGRTHQIRVHMAHLGHPVLGDPRLRQGLPDQGGEALAPERDRALEALGRQALHAAELGFEHPISRQAAALHEPAAG